MADERKYSAREAAIAILDKAKEVLQKSEGMTKCGTFSKVHAKVKREGYSEESADKIAGHAKAMEKAENKAAPSKPPAAKEQVAGEADAPGARIESQVAPGANPKEQAEGNNEAWGTDPGVKGHVKLAKFLGRMEHKRTAKQALAAPAQAPADKLGKVC